MEEEHPLLLHSSKRWIKASRSGGFLPKVRLRLARTLKAFGRSAYHLRHRKPTCRLALCMPKTPNYFTSFTSKIEGNPHGPFPIHSHMRRVKHHDGRSNSSPHSNHPLHPPLHHYHSPYDDGGHYVEDVSERLALLHLQTSDKHHNISSWSVNPRLCKQTQFATHHMVVSCERKKLARVTLGGNNDWLKRRIQRWHHRVNGTLTSLGTHKDRVPHDVPKGCVGVHVGVEHTRFVVPILHLNHPLFASVFECTRENDEFSQSGPLWIPCDVCEFEMLHSQVKQLSKKH